MLKLNEKLTWIMFDVHHGFEAREPNYMKVVLSRNLFAPYYAYFRFEI